MQLFVKVVRENLVLDLAHAAEAGQGAVKRLLEEAGQAVENVNYAGAKQVDQAVSRYQALTFNEGSFVELLVGLFDVVFKARQEGNIAVVAQNLSVRNHIESK